MKFVKFGMLALTLGLFLTSCGGGESTEATGEDTTTIVAPVMEEPVAPIEGDTTAPAAETAIEATEAPAQ